MKHFRVSLAAVSFASMAFTFAAPAVQAQDNAIIDRHMAAATRAAKADLLGALGLCKTATPEPVVGFMDNYNKMKLEPPLEPMQVTDELYFLGNYWTSAWAVKTSKGIVIIDALDNADEAKQYIEGGLRKLKLNLLLNPRLLSRRRHLHLHACILTVPIPRIMVRPRT